MYENIFDNLKESDNIERRLRSLFEGKSWEYIANALYRILEDINTSDMCKEDLRGFQNVVMRLQAKKNAYLFSPDGYSLQLVNEAVATKGLQKELVDQYGIVTGKQLKKTIWARGTEVENRKFWLLTNGKLVSILYAHEQPTRSFHSYLNKDELFEEGAFAGYVTDSGEMGGYTRKDRFNFTSQQIITLKKLFIEYKIKEVAFDLNEEQKDIFRSVNSVKKLEYLLMYGTLDEVKIIETIADRVWDFLRENPNSTFNEVLDGIDATGEDAGKFEDTVKDMLNKSIYVEDGKYNIVEITNKILSDPQQKVKDFYKDRINTRLRNSTFEKENYPKFWLLTDGTIVPVDFTHVTTIRKVGLDYYVIEDDDAVGGYIKGTELGLPLSINQELTAEQKVTVKKLYNEYPIDHILTGPLGGDAVHVLSSRDLSRFLSSGAYRGKKVWESTDSLNSKLEEWVFAVIENVKEALELDEIEKDKWAVLDYLKSNYQVETSEELWENMAKAVMDWYVSEVRESLCENLCAFAKKELGLAGLFDKDSDYNGMIGEAVMELMQTLSSQGHSGFSADLTMTIFDKLAAWEPLTEITDNFDEWRDVSEYQSGKPGWQNTRNSSCFSEDKGKTYWDIDEDYYKYEDEDGEVWSGSLSKEEWKNRPMHTTKHFEVKED